jgi:hypothetical protein
VGKKANLTAKIFFFGGELLNGQNGTFLGLDMFIIKSGRCLMISPLFWTSIAIGLSIIVIGILKHCVKSSESEKMRSLLKYIPKHIDSIVEEELWIGGLASFSIVVLVSFAYIFSNAYLK